MKRTVAGILTIVLVIAFFCVIGCNQPTNHYEVSAVVDGLWVEEDLVLFTDVNGDGWCWKGIETFEENDEVVLVLDNSNTPNDNTDDQIIEIKAK